MTKPLNGQQKADENLTTFTSWAASKTDSDLRDMVTRGQLNRMEISRECNFAKSVLLQNPRVRDSLKQLEADLRERGEGQR
ncbi:MAG TPA: VPA1267 family protein [Thauera sp.]|nr:VPA1267 family protein [Thauera sp.]